MAARKNYAVNSKPGLNVRQYPSKDAPIQRVLSDGAKVTVDNKADAPAGWKALIGGGYVMDQFLK